MKRGGVILLAAALLWAPPLRAQSGVELRSSLAVYSAYEARGLTFTDGLVAQATVEIEGRAAGFGLAAGAWTNMEPPSAATSRLRMLPAEVGGPSEVNLYATITRHAGPVELELGTIHFLFPRGFDFSRPGLLVELYGRARLDARGSPELAAYYDFTAGGWYGKLQAGHERELGRGTVRATAGLGGSLGQADAGEYYAADGVTHVGAHVRYEWRAAGVTLGPEAGWSYGVDAATRAATSLQAGRSRVLLGFAVSWRPVAR